MRSCTAVLHAVIGIGLAAGITLFGPAATVAQTQQPLNAKTVLLDWCMGKDNATPDRIINSCTMLIQQGEFTGANLAAALNNRGVAYSAKKMYDRAIQDFDRAIRLNPNFTQAIENRAAAVAQKRP